MDFRFLNFFILNPPAFHFSYLVYRTHSPRGCCISLLVFGKTWKNNTVLENRVISVLIGDYEFHPFLLGKRALWKSWYSEIIPQKKIEKVF